MRVLSKTLLVSFIAAFGLYVGNSFAIDVKEEHSRRINASKAIAPLGEDLFGDQISYFTGGTEFQHGDVSLSGNSGLPVAIGRTHKVGADGPTALGLFGEWDIDIPYMYGIFGTELGWQNYGAGDARCSSITVTNYVPPTSSGYVESVNGTRSISGSFGGDEYWSGNQLHVQGQGDKLLLAPVSGYLIKPNDGQTYRLATTDHWAVSCLPAIKNGLGEGFRAVSPSGVVYHFDWMVKRKFSKLNRIYNFANGSVNRQFDRSKIFLYPTRVEDRFGNWVNYTWSGDTLQSIEANDGRKLTLAYVQAGSGSNVGLKISSVSDGIRTWKYTYSTSGLLTAVVLPDNSQWTLSTAPAVLVYVNNVGYSQSSGCNPSLTPNNSIYKYTITHPSGASAEFDFKMVRHGRSMVTPKCQWSTADKEDVWDAPQLRYDAISIIKKKISGQNVTERIWTVAYGATNDSWHTCTTCPTTKTVEVTDSSGDFQRYTFSNHYGKTEGKLAKVESSSSATSPVLNVTQTNYLTDPSSPPFVVNVGNAGNYKNRDPIVSKVIPISANTVNQDGVTFTSAVNSFDSFAQPTSITKSSSLGYSSTDTIAYENNLSKWVLGQVKTVTNSNTGKVVSDTTYDANALPIASSSFGLPQGSTTYNADGTIATMKDAKNNTTTLSNYYRGVPRSIGFADGTSLSAAVNDNGWITSMTDQLGSTTTYEYDAMGRMSKTNFPTGDTNAWTPMNYWFRPLTNGMWTQSTWDDRYAKETQYDALWRPVLQSEWDWADGGNTVRRKVWRYDSAGRQAFESYPFKESTDFNALPGIRTEYDALGRVTKVKQDSELGVLTTSTEYLSGFQTKTTNPKGVVTRQGYQVFDVPDTSRPVFTVYAEGTPESKVHDVARDVFGNVFAHAMRDAANTYTKHHWYVRDANMRVCKTTTPEGGATHYEYDANGNVIRMAEGDTTYTNTSTCDAQNIALSEKTITTYDVMNRVTNIDVPGGANGDKSYGYEADGLVSYITNTSNNQGTVNRYAYNKRRLLTSESSEQTGWYVWGIGYAYNNNAALSRITYPTGFYVDYAPNGLGQATQAASGHGTWANNVQYYPNGAVKQFTYGNGIVHTMTQNARQLPSQSRDALGTTAIIDFTTAFDANGNVTNYNDPGQAGRNNRAMFYDSLDRLTLAYAPNLWGHANYQYDALDNLKRSTLGAAGFTYHYDATNRIQRVDRDGGGSYNYQHDSKGQVTNDGRNGYTWDAAGRLHDVHGKEWYRYDGNNRRVLACDPAACIMSVYGQDGALYYQQNDREGQNYEYIYLGDDLVATRNCCIGNVIKTRYQHTDALGSPVATTNEAGAVVDRTEYAPYGAPLNRPVSGVGYTGHVMDSTTGLVYAQQRYYDPLIGRFLSTDPMMADRNNGWNFNRYNYAANNPYKYTDPDGRNPVTGFIGAVIGSGVETKKQYDAGNLKVGEFPSAKTFGAVFLASTKGFAVGALVGSIPPASGLIVQTGGAVVIGTGASAAEQAVTGSKVDIRQAATEGLFEAGGVGAGKLLSPAVKPLATISTPAVEGMVVKSLSGKEFVHGARQGSKFVDPATKEALQDIGSSALVTTAQEKTR
jgi:RHS repeat-associated protein